MSHAKGTRLWLRPARPERGERAVWIIRDGKRSRSTGFGQHELEKAEETLRGYLAEKHDPAKSRGSDPLAARLPDVLSLYAREVATSHARPAETGRRLEMVLNHFGDIR